MSLTALIAISVLQPLSFGEIAIVKNSVPSRLVVPRGGAPYSYGQIYIIEPGVPAEVLLYDGPANTELTIDVNYNDKMTSVFSTNQFTLRRLDYPTKVYTDSSGQATFKIGAELTNSNNSEVYRDIDYATEFNITVSF